MSATVLERRGAFFRCPLNWKAAALTVFPPYQMTSSHADPTSYQFHPALGRGLPRLGRKRASVPHASVLTAVKERAVGKSSVLFLLVFGLAGCTSTPAAPTVSEDHARQEAGLIDIQTLIPTIALDIRYAGIDNFVGTKIDGYEAPKCFLLASVADALRRVELELQQQHMRLKLYDCYRPRRAVLHFVRWAADMQEQRSKSAYYPNLDKGNLLGDYISPTSGHSFGATLDLTLQKCDVTGRACEPLDMGTDFDFFDTRANTDSPLVTPGQRLNRESLLAAMKRHGFVNYPLEWWHFTFRPEVSPKVPFDVPVR
ncbi:MAG: M15 family metallopeptidase [Luteimonas sp.]